MVKHAISLLFYSTEACGHALRARRIASGRSDESKKRNEAMDQDADARNTIALEVPCGAQKSAYCCSWKVLAPAILNTLIEVRGN